MPPCTSCSVTLPEGASFCSSCGTKQVQQPKGQFCTTCGVQGVPGARFCAGCGHPFGGGPAQVPVAMATGVPAIDTAVEGMQDLKVEGELGARTKQQPVGQTAPSPFEMPQWKNYGAPSGRGQQQQATPAATSAGGGGGLQRMGSGHELNSSPPSTMSYPVVSKASGGGGPGLVGPQPGEPAYEAMMHGGHAPMQRQTAGENAASAGPTFFGLNGATRKNQPYKIVVIGQTGSGKSTFINTICNALRGGSLKKLKVLIATRYLTVTEKDSVKDSEQDVKNPTVAQTSHCISYSFTHAGSGAQFQIIDTPGLADTKGTQQDEFNIANILQFCSKMDYVDCIAIVVNGSVARFDVCMRTVCQRFRGNLPDTVLNTIAVVFTNCTKLTRNFDPAVIESNLMGPKGGKLNSKNMYHVQNTFFSSDPKHWTADDVNSELQPLWERSMKTIQEFLEHVMKNGATNTKDFAIMRDTRDMLKSKMADVLAEINKLDKLRQKIEQAKVLQSKAAADQNLYKNYKVTEEIDVYEQEDTVRHNTNCMTHQVTCHEGCGLDEIKNRGDPAFGNCACFHGASVAGNCKVCEQVSKTPCGTTNHYHDNKKWVHRKETVDKILQNVLDKYQECTNDFDSQVKAQNQAEADLQALEDILDNRMVEIQMLCHKLFEICTNFNFAAELHSIIQLWEWELTTITDRQTRTSLEKRIAFINEVIKKLNKGPM